MRERLDCALLLTRCTEEWVTPLLGQHAGGRLYMHELGAAVDVGKHEASGVLLGAAMALRRYDACIIPVSPATLPWARISLSRASQELQTPVIALVRDLTAAALQDLHELGMADFLRAPFCNHELRMRVERLLDGRRGGGLGSGPRRVAEGGAVARDYALKGVGAHADPPPKYCAPDQSDPESYAMAMASRSDAARESFRDAKRQVVNRFERAYITTALSRHGGNIAMAARSAQKHRRAFWALMRKHEISAEGFRRFPAVGYLSYGQVGTSVTAEAACRKVLASTSESD